MGAPFSGRIFHVNPAPALALAGTLLACSSVSAPLAFDAEGPAPAAALEVRLLFGAGADLDLYVSDPRQETVYFGNSPTKTGGRLLQDVRCDASPPRMERVVFSSPPRGRYRVGVDYPQRCSRLSGAAEFRVVVEAAGQVQEELGQIQLGEFKSHVLEFEFR